MRLRRVTACAAALLGVAAIAGVHGCATGGVGAQELSAAPIAVLYWTPEEARRRKEAAVEELRGPGPERRGVARAHDLGALFGATPETSEEAARRFPGHLSLIDPPSGRIERVEAAPPGAVPMAWSADHRRLLFASDRIAGSWQLYEFDRPSGELRPLTHGPLDHPHGDYGPDGRLAYVERNPLAPEREGVYLGDPRRGGSWLVLARPSVQGVRWSPRGDMLLLVVSGTATSGRDRGGRSGAPRSQPAPTGGGWTLYSLTLPDAAARDAEAGRGALRPLGRGRTPDFSRDGDWFVYSAAVGRGWRLGRMRSIGGGRRTLGASRRDEHEPALSPDEALVAYVAADEFGLQRLFVKRLDGSGERVLLPDGVVARPVW